MTRDPGQATALQAIARALTSDQAQALLAAARQMPELWPRTAAARTGPPGRRRAPKSPGWNPATAGGAVVCRHVLTLNDRYILIFSDREHLDLAAGHKRRNAPNDQPDPAAVPPPTGSTGASVGAASPGPTSRAAVGTFGVAAQARPPAPDPRQAPRWALPPMSDLAGKLTDPPPPQPAAAAPPRCPGWPPGAGRQLASGPKLPVLLVPHPSRRGPQPRGRR